MSFKTNKQQIQKSEFQGWKVYRKYKYFCRLEHDILITAITTYITPCTNIIHQSKLIKLNVLPILGKSLNFELR